MRFLKKAHNSHLDLPGMSTIINVLNCTQPDLVLDWINSFPYRTNTNGTLRLDENDLGYIKNGGPWWSASHEFFKIFKNKKSGKKIDYLKEILLKKKEDFKTAIDVLMK